jgi:hypothetical protein
MKMLKLIVSIALLIGTFQYCTGQDTCTIRLSTGFTGLRIDLLDSNKFEYYSYSCTHRAEGKGAYSLDDKELRLKFVKKVDTNHAKSRVVSIESKPNCTEKLNLTFKVFYDKDNTPLPGAAIRLIGTQKGAVIKKNGEAKIINLNGGGEMRIKISYIGLEALDSTIFFENQDYIVTVNLAKDKRFPIIIEDEEIIYRIANRTSDSIELSLGGDGYKKYEINCR